MVAWIHALDTLALPAVSAVDPTPVVAQSASGGRAANEPVPLRDGDQIVAVLCQMVLPLAA
jgi:hypothetical protein